jgi:hypothetical protein
VDEKDRQIRELMSEIGNPKAATGPAIKPDPSSNTIADPQTQVNLLEAIVTKDQAIASLNSQISASLLKLALARSRSGKEAGFDILMPSLPLFGWGQRIYGVWPGNRDFSRGRDLHLADALVFAYIF